LKDESPAVQRVVTASAPVTARHAVQAELLLDSQDLFGDRPASREVLDWVLSLWPERLVGDVPERPDDPPPIVLLTRLSPREGYRICQLAGQVKLVLAGQEGQSRVEAASRSVRARREWLRDHLAEAHPDPDFVVLARHDVEAGSAARLPWRRREARIGLVTVARLLAGCEPFRVRFALQHWPYTIAKLIRSLMRPAARWSPHLLHGESLVLITAWDRLNLERRLPARTPDQDRNPPDTEGAEPS
jgi:hypothetical protein